jgi:hypothetical protein
MVARGRSRTLPRIIIVDVERRTGVMARGDDFTDVGREMRRAGDMKRDHEQRRAEDSEEEHTPSWSAPHARRA